MDFKAAPTDTEHSHPPKEEESSPTKGNKESMYKHFAIFDRSCSTFFRDSQLQSIRVFLILIIIGCYVMLLVEDGGF